MFIPTNMWELLLQGDVDRDGHLDYGEFVAISVHLRKMGTDGHLRKAFQFFDQNQSGYIEIEELRDALSDDIESNSEEVINAIMHDVDTDKVSPFSLCRSIFFFFFFAWLYIKNNYLSSCFIAQTCVMILVFVYFGTSLRSLS